MMCKNCGDPLEGSGRCNRCDPRITPKSAQEIERISQASVPISETHGVTIIKQRYDYMPEIKRLVVSAPFIIGSILITAAQLGTFSLDITWQSILNLIFSTFHICGLWLLIIGNIVSKDPKKATLTSLSLFKVAIVVSLIGYIIAFGGIALLLLVGLMRGFVFLLILAIVVVLAFVIIKYYIIALISTLNGIRDRIIYEDYFSLEGLGSFVVMSYIGIGFIMLLSIVALASAAATAITAWSLMFVAMSSVGLILCLVRLQQFYDESDIASRLD